MNDFPEFMKHPYNKISARSQYSKGVEGYVFDGADGGQMTIWTCELDGRSQEHAHDFDEYLVVVQGKYTLIISGETIPLDAVPAGEGNVAIGEFVHARLALMDGGGDFQTRQVGMRQRRRVHIFHDDSNDLPASLQHAIRDHAHEASPAASIYKREAGPCEGLTSEARRSHKIRGNAISRATVNANILHKHLYGNGFRASITFWTKKGQVRVLLDRPFHA